MNIGEAAEAAKLPAKTVRYYEEIKLIIPARLANGYRDYAPEDVHRLSFIQRARSLGFSIDECRTLLSLYDDKERSSSSVKALAEQKIAKIDQKLKEMHTLRDTLAQLVDHCHGDSRPDCPIIDEMARENT